jgi:signal transduction histidine kinase
MNFGFRQEHREAGGGFVTKVGHFLRRIVEFLQIPAPDAPQLIRRIELMEREIILPIKAAVIAMLLQSFYLTPSPWIGSVLSALDIAVESTQYFVWVYIAINLVVGALLLAMHHIPLAIIEWAIFAASLVDGIFLGALTLVSGGYDSPLYWLFLALIVRSAVSVPRAASQLMLNFTLSACYVLAGVIDVAVAENLDEPTRRWVDLSGPPENVAEPLVLRLILLLLMSVCCYGVQVLFERQRKALEEAREFALREGQLRSAGRLAAEFAHQIKNPLAIINNAAYSLDRALRQGKREVNEQIQIIQEEVERSDRIITEIMGYAQLSEGRVEKLALREELDHAVERVFPPGAGYPVRVHRDCQGDFPPLLMQRRHLTETLINILQNAREALGEQGGNVFVQAHLLPENTIEISIQDDGPGIPPDKQERIFEAYYTTREKGTGLGLATVKHNVELYGGNVRVESGLGKGACFTVTLPAKSLPKSANAN